LAVIMLDVDHFKQFNDTFGHEAGDLVLKQVAATLIEHARDSDVVSRFSIRRLRVKRFCHYLPYQLLTSFAGSCFSSGSARWPSLDGIQRIRRNNLIRVLASMT